MHVDKKLLVHNSCLLAIRVSPYVAFENVGRVTIWACGTLSNWDEVMFVSCVMCSSFG
jgi:hypothetical protein